TFVDAYMKARPNEKRADKHYDAKVEWNKIKWNEEYVKEIIEEYFSKYNEFEASSREVEEEFLYEYPKELPGATGCPFEALVKQKKTPAQERIFLALISINAHIATLVQVGQMAYELKRLQSKQISSIFFFFNFIFFYVDHLFETKPELHTQLKKLYRRGAGRPRVEEQCPNLLQIIKEIVKVGGASDDRRQSEIIRSCLTLDDLREKIKQRGYDIKRTTLYYR
ncbi:unnamed protein product, partial [Rotaria sp. Silwood1]